MTNTGPQVAARPATVDDLGAIVAIAQAGLDEQRDARGGSVWAVRETRPAPFELSLRESITDPDKIVFVGTIDDVVVGYVAVRAEHLRSGDALGVIEDLHVLPDAREVGVGEALVGVVLPWCEARDCVGVDALALPGNRATKNFFESFGFKARLLTVHRPLR
jgi:ribosomal protein S18 acetylase RimI-like enzyme